LALAAADEIQAGEVELPQWVPIAQLRLADIQSHGEIVFAALQRRDPPD
jgi:hypothetical protein